MLLLRVIMFDYGDGGCGPSAVGCTAFARNALEHLLRVAVASPEERIEYIPLDLSKAVW